MIHYRQNSPLGFDVLFRVWGSVIPYSLPRALVAGFFCFALAFWKVIDLQSGGGLMYHPNPFTFYFQIAAFVLAFHSNQAYNRFWEARTQLQAMACYWGDSMAHLLAFERAKSSTAILKCPPLGSRRRAAVTPTSPTATSRSGSTLSADTSGGRDVEWRAKIVHLFSLLHAVCISYLLSRNSKPLELEVLGGIDVSEQRALRDTDDHAFLVAYWITEEMSRRHVQGGLQVPPPVMSRTYQLFNLGTLAYNQACKIEDTPFPFPYIQLLYFIDFSLMFVTPVVMSCWVQNIALAVVLTMLAVGAFHALFAAAGLMESPFGTRPNDLPMLDLNNDFINRLKSLLDPQIADALNDLVIDAHDGYRTDKGSNCPSTSMSHEPVKLAASKVFFSPYLQSLGGSGPSSKPTKRQSVTSAPVMASPLPVPNKPQFDVARVFSGGQLLAETVVEECELNDESVPFFSPTAGEDDPSSRAKSAPHLTEAVREFSGARSDTPISVNVQVEQSRLRRIGSKAPKRGKAHKTSTEEDA